MDKYVLEYLESKIQSVVSKKALQILRSKYPNIIDLDFLKFGSVPKNIYHCPKTIFYKGQGANDPIQREYNDILSMEVKLYLAKLIDKLIK